MHTLLGIVPYKMLPAKVGGQKGLHLFYQALSKHFAVTVIGTKSNDTQSSNLCYQLIPLFNRSIFKYFNPINLFAILNVIRKKNPTTVVFEHPYLLIYQFLVKYLTRRQVIVHSHNIEYLRFKSLGKKWWWGLQFWEGWSYQIADKIFFISEEDRNFAIKKWHLHSSKTMVVPYGIEIEDPIHETQKKSAKAMICEQLKIEISTTLFFFNGSLHYLPNASALEDMRNKLFPLLMHNYPNRKYALIVTGTKLNYIQQSNIHKMGIPAFFLGFVDDISMYYKGCDIFLNLVNGGGGIKTKLIEALGYGMNAVSYNESAWGVDKNCVVEKLFCSDDIAEISHAIHNMEQHSYKSTPISFYEKYTWIHIARRVYQWIG